MICEMLVEGSLLNLNIRKGRLLSLSFPGNLPLYGRDAGIPNFLIAAPRSRYRQASAAGHRGLRTASPNFPQTRLAAAQCRQSLSVNNSSLLRDTAEPCRLLKQVIVNVQSRPHMYQYA